MRLHTAILFALALGFAACDKDDDNDLTPVKAAEQKLPGTWQTVKVTANGTDISSATSSTIIFEEDKTYSAISTESGINFADSGNWEVRANGDTLRFYTTNSGTVNYFIHHLSNDELSIEIPFLGAIRRYEFEKQ